MNTVIAQWGGAWGLHGVWGTGGDWAATCCHTPANCLPPCHLGIANGNGESYWLAMLSVHGGGLNHSHRVVIATGTGAGLAVQVILSGAVIRGWLWVKVGVWHAVCVTNGPQPM